jgi:uncharacterized delta-60 repeat protein
MKVAAPIRALSNGIVFVLNQGVKCAPLMRLLANKALLGRSIPWVLALAFSLISQNVLAQEGAPDASFQIQQVAPNQICLQPDGKILLAGTFGQNPNFSYVMRLNADGSVDTSFTGSDESLATSAYSLTTTASGYTYLLCSLNNTHVLQRYLTATGQTDAAFTPLTIPSQYVAGYLVLANGQVLVWGDAIYRLNADGSIDNTFQNPALPSAPPDTLNLGIEGMSVGSNGTMYFWGSFATLGGVSRSNIARLNSDGSIDPGFVPVTGDFSGITHVVLEPSGTLLLSGYSTSGALMLARLNAHGSRITSLQSPVLQSSGTPSPNSITGVTETSDQKILLWGNISQINETPVPGYAKLNLDGTVDSSFAANATINGIIQNIVVLPDGELLLTGKLNRSDLTYTVPLVLLKADGTVDANFDLAPENQIASLGSYIAGPVLTQPDGKILTSLIYYNPVFDGGGGGSIIIVTNPPPPPPPLFVRYNGEGNYLPHRPITLTVTSVSASLTHLAWNSVANVTGYQIERENAGQWAVLASLGPNANSYDDTTADGVTNFPYRVEAQNALGFSLPSPTAMASLPIAFTITSASAVSPNQVNLGWTASAGEWDYEIYRANGALTTFTQNNGTPSLPLLATVPASATSYVDTTVSSRQTYTYIIVARNVAGTTFWNAQTFAASGSLPTVVYVTTPSDAPPATPIRFLAGSASANEIELVWESTAWATGYTVERSPDGVSGWQVIATLGSSASSYFDPNLSANQTFFYRITAFDAVGASSASMVTSAYAPDSSWVAPGALDSSFAPSPPLAEVARVKLSPSGSIYYLQYSPFSDENMNFGKISTTGVISTFNSSFTVTQSDILAYAPLASDEVLVNAPIFHNPTTYQMELLDPTGARDFSFTPPSVTGLIDNILALRGGGFLLIGSFTAVNGSPANGIARLHADGTLDPGFSMTGIPLHSSGFLVAEQSNGSLVVTLSGTTVVRLLTNGQEDPTFGQAGQVVLNGFQSTQVIQPDDKIVLGGNFTSVDDGSGPVADNSLVRLTADGRIDPTFNIGTGFVPTLTTVISPSESVIVTQEVQSLSLDQQGRILVQGFIYQYDSISCATLIRLLPNGQLDPSFLLPQGFDSSNFILNTNGQTFYAGSTLKRYFYGPSSNGTPLSYSQWQTANSITGSPTASPLNDGVPNLLKYVYHINPSRPMSATDWAALPATGTTTSGGTPCLTLTYRQNGALSRVTVNVQTSSDLTTWQTLANTAITQTGADHLTGDPIMQAQVPFTGTAQFLRLNVTNP